MQRARPSSGGRDSAAGFRPTGRADTTRNVGFETARGSRVDSRGLCREARLQGNGLTYTPPHSFLSSVYFHPSGAVPTLASVLKTRTPFCIFCFELERGNVRTRHLSLSPCLSHPTSLAGAEGSISPNETPGDDPTQRPSPARSLRPPRGANQAPSTPTHRFSTACLHQTPGRFPTTRRGWDSKRNALGIDKGVREQSRAGTECTPPASSVAFTDRPVAGTLRAGSSGRSSRSSIATGGRADRGGDGDGGGGGKPCTYRSIARKDS